MPGTTFRNYEGPADVERQYELWLRATEGLPYAWRSNLTNALYVTRPAERHAGARLYAERDGRLVGYIGTHPPVQWDTGEWLIPFGFPWTHPADHALERELYARMLAATPRVYPGAPVVGYVQRFRESWRRHTQFLIERGWRQRWRHPLLARAVSPSEPATALSAMPVRGDDLPTVCQIAAADPRAVDVEDEAALRRRLEGGWLEFESLWQVPGRGAFEMEVRPPWGEVRLFYAYPDADQDDSLWDALDVVARRQGATEVYLTLDEREPVRREQLLGRRFREMDAGVYLVLEAPAHVAEAP